MILEVKTLQVKKAFKHTVSSKSFKTLKSDIIIFDTINISHPTWRGAGGGRKVSKSPLSKEFTWFNQHKCHGVEYKPLEKVWI